MKNKMKMIITTTFLLLAVSTVSAQPAFPDLFHGDLTVNGEESPSGTEIVAKVDGEEAGSIVTEQAGAYGYSDPDRRQLAVSSSAEGSIDFYIRTSNGSLSVADSQSQDVEYRSEGDIRRVDLGFEGIDLVTAEAGDDVEVDEGESVELEGSSTGFNSPVYSWSISDDPTGSASLTGSGQAVDFEAPEDVDEDQVVDVDLTVESDQNDRVASDSLEVTVADTDEETVSEPGSSGPSSDPQPRSIQASSSNGQASAQVYNVEADQSVEVSVPANVSNPPTVEQVSFTPSVSSDSASVSISDLGSDRPSEVSEDAGSDVYSYQEISVDGVEDDDISESTVNFRVKKSFLEERDRSAEDVVMKRYNQGWDELETRIDEELEDAYRFEASSTGFSYYAVALREVQQEDPQPDIQVSSLNVNPSDGEAPYNVTVEVTAENNGEGSGTEQVEVTAGSDTVISEQVELGSGESTTLSAEYTVEQETVFSSGSQQVTATVQPDQEKDDEGRNLVPYIGLVLVVALVTAGIWKRELLAEKFEEFRG